MGIQGLLPLLKPIQRQRHLSDFAGQTIAVDAYVWLHRGAYGCATELVTGKPTRKYVDFCMQRVRLLRHHGISPYLVFDGGPLPAKLGTEKERERKRAENIQKAQEFVKQGRHTEAREYYVKCVDITPEMAYQVIKALKAENIPYVVAPYEADAQLAYLERSGVVDGIITEDSDLLVFGCKNVLFKLDPVSSSVCFISRSDFGSPSLATESLSLVGWSDAQFRWMAMLSGCDYLPSVPGVGLKTAWSLLKKYKSVDRSIRAIRMEGKKDVPKGYIEAFNLAEKVFLHQRVYDPTLQKLVYLSDPSDDLVLDDRAESYIGKDLKAELAKKIAEGDVCPISLAEMKDINPTFVPRASKEMPLQNQDVNSGELDAKKSGKGKAPAVKGLLNFFSPVSKTKPISSSSSKPIVAGKASGKRTLVDAMQDDMAAKRKKLEADRQRRRQSAPALSNSRFFANTNHPANIAIAGPSRLTLDSELEKENTPPVISEEMMELDENEVEEEEDIVTQEDGYISPSPSLSRNLTPDLSSPVRFRVEVFEVEDEVLSGIAEPGSPASPGPLRNGGRTQDVEELFDQTQEPHIFVRGSSEVRAPSPVIPGPDLRKNFDDDSDFDEKSSEIGTWDEDEPLPKPSQVNGAESNVVPLSLSATPPEQTQVVVIDDWEAETHEDDVLDPDEEEALLLIAQSAARERIAQAWKSRFSFGGNAGPSARQQQQTPKISKGKVLKNTVAVSAPPSRRQSAPSSQAQSSMSVPKSRAKPTARRSEPYPKPVFVDRDPISLLSSDDTIEEVVTAAKGRLAAFRFAR